MGFYTGLSTDLYTPLSTVWLSISLFQSLKKSIDVPCIYAKLYISSECGDFFT